MKETRWLFRIALLVFTVAALNGGAWARETVVRIGGDAVVSQGDVVAGNAVVLGGSLTVAGRVRDAVVIGGSLDLTGDVAGDAVVVGGSVVLRPGARVAGDLTVVGGKIEGDTQGVVGGELNEIGIGDGFGLNFTDWGSLWWWRGPSVGYTLFYVAALFALAIAVVAIKPQNVSEVAESMSRYPGRSALIGAAAVLLLLPLSLVLLITVVGAPLLWLVFVAAKALGYVAAVWLLGRSVSHRYFPEINQAWQIGVGVVLLALLRMLPFFGALVGTWVTIWSVGAVLDTKFGTNRPWLPPKTP